MPNQETILNDAGHIINNLLHEKSKKLSSVKCYDSVDVFLIDIENYLRSVNPLLLSFLFVSFYCHLYYCHFCVIL